MERNHMSGVVFMLEILFILFIIIVIGSLIVGIFVAPFIMIFKKPFNCPVCERKIKLFGKISKCPHCKTKMFKHANGQYMVKS